MIDASVEELAESLGEYAGQLSRRREVLEELAGIGHELTGRLRNGAFSGLPELLDRRGLVLQRLERVLSQTRDVDRALEAASGLTYHPTAAIAESASALTEAGLECAAAVATILQCQAECEEILSGAVGAERNRLKQAKQASRFADTYHGHRGTAPRFLDSKQ